MNEVMNNMDLENIDLNAPAPGEEVSRQYYYMAKAKQYVKELADKLGHKPTCCVTTFGCQMNVEPVTA